MESQELPFDDDVDHKEQTTTTLSSYSNLLSTIDTSRPFRSVKEAVAIFGERFLAREIYTPKPPFTIPKHETASQKPFSPLFSSPPNPPPPPPPPSTSSLLSLVPIPQYYSEGINDHEFSNDHVKIVLKKLETELEETKRELSLLKERESETEIALASLNAELHKNMSKIAEAEAKAAGEKAMVVSTRSTTTQNDQHQVETMYLKSLSEVLSLGEKDGYFGEKKKKKKKREKKMMKEKKLKPIIPLVGDLFSWKKNSSSSNKNDTLNNSLYTSHMYFN